MTETIVTLDPNVKQDVSYCIPIWLRDEQIKLAIARVKGRIEPYKDSGGRKEPVAVVCFGPSLNDTWEQIKDFKYIISCSGAHKFLIDKGIVPTWHTAVDPLPKNTVELIGVPHKDVEYLIASTCNPDVFTHLEGYNVKLWHVFDTKEEGLRTLPFGEWALTGGCDVGSRSITIAAFLGFRDIHIFGMDGSYAADKRHAASHPTSNGIKGNAVCPYDGIEYRTTPAMLEAARQVWHELDQMPAVRTKFYGEGLVQHMARNYKPTTSKQYKHLVNNISYIKDEVISKGYRDLNAQLHVDNLSYGVGGGKHAQDVINLSKVLNTRSILDYGCGKGYLAKALPFPIWEYDPAIPEKSENPRPADLVICTDVLEHIEPDKILHVLMDLKRCVLRIGLFVINTGPAMKKLADGRNTHLIQKDEQWWVKILSKFFTVKVNHDRSKNNNIYVVVEPRSLSTPKIAPPKLVEIAPVIDIDMELPVP